MQQVIWRICTKWNFCWGITGILPSHYVLMPNFQEKRCCAWFGGTRQASNENTNWFAKYYCAPHNKQTAIRCGNNGRRGAHTNCMESNMSSSVISSHKDLSSPWSDPTAWPILHHHLITLQTATTNATIIFIPDINNIYRWRRLLPHLPIAQPLFHAMHLPSVADSSRMD